jgi:hypothetical protein
MTRIEQIRDKLAASLQADGKPKRGYTLRVAALRRELSSLELGEAARIATQQDSPDRFAPGVDTLPDPA